MPKPTQTGSGEDRLIARYFRPLAKHPSAFGLTDDAAALTPPEHCDLVLKTDPIIAGVHFFADDPADAVARKALRVNLSDLVAKGAEPVGFLMALALPAQIGEDWLLAFARGLGEDVDRFECPLLGGDTDQTPGLLTISITAFGALPRGTMVKRSGAKVGDRVFVTGTIGDAALGLKLRLEPQLAGRLKLDARSRDYLLERYLVPQPRMALAEALRSHASAAMDISDGLAGDFAKLCRVSNVTARIETGLVPVSDAARKVLDADPSLMETILTGGDDYEILCTVPAGACARFRNAASTQNVFITEIGSIISGDEPPSFYDLAGIPFAFARPSHSHF